MVYVECHDGEDGLENCRPERPGAVMAAPGGADTDAVGEDREARLRALCEGLMLGECSGEPVSFDFDDFVSRMRAQIAPSVASQDDRS